MTYTARLATRLATRELELQRVEAAAAGERPTFLGLAPDGVSIGVHVCAHCGAFLVAHDTLTRLCPEWALRAQWGDR